MGPRDHLHEDYLESFQKYRFLGSGITGLDRDGARDSVRILKFKGHLYVQCLRNGPLE